MQIREATPVFNELTEDLDPAKTPADDIRAQQSKVDDVQRRLVGAKSDYARILADAPDKETVERRIAILGELIDTLQWGVDRVRVPRMLRQASTRVAEATPLYKRVADGRDSARDATERATLKTMQELALAKLREARGLYVQVKAAAPNAEEIGLRIQSLDLLIETLEAEPPPPNVPELTKDASAKIQEAMPLYQKYTDGTGSAEDGARSRALLWEARSDYLRAQAGTGGPDADALASKIRSLDDLIEALDGALPPKK
jgi:hypothetical protein